MKQKRFKMRDEAEAIEDEEPRCHPFLFIPHPSSLPSSLIPSLSSFLRLIPSSLLPEPVRLLIRKVFVFSLFSAVRIRTLFPF
jgi:hypothetical protein